ncbi:putative ribonuclease H-like domain-containing protein [Tanacetum coccineum]|uniref:Ribonuclease H-like domain-containing protein n=1 Tax=Tanacetum coccineum TaxID=301880 RepID=A0ABQ4X7S2_9ASTR
MCDKKNYVLFTDTKCLVLSPNFKLSDESQILLKIPKKDNMYSFDMKNIVPKESLTCLVTNATLDQSMLWHRRLGHINFKNINKLVKDNLVRGLPTKCFENDQTCVACIKRKQHRASCKFKVLNLITKPLFMLHTDLFGPTFVNSLMHKKYCLAVTDDYSRFTWVFFLTTKDETSEILKNFIKEIENLVDKKVKIIRSDNGTEFKNKVIDDFCREKSDSKLPTTFWAEAVSTACYVQNRVLVVKPHNKTPYELFRGFKPALSFMRPFGCHVTILNTLDNLGKFDGKNDEGFFVGYSLSSKAFRVYNTRTRRVEENLHIGFLENKPMIEGNGPKWLFDIDSLTQSMNYVPVAACAISNESACIQEEFNAGTSTQKEEISQDCIVMPIWKDASYFDSPSKYVGNVEPKSATDDQKHVEDGPHNESDEKDKCDDDSSPKEVNTVGQHVNTTSPEVNTGRCKLNTVDPSVNTVSSSDPDSPKDMFTMGVSHTLEEMNQKLIWGTPLIPIQLNPQALPKLYLIHNAGRTSAVQAPTGLQKKKDERGIVIRNKARLVTQGHRQEKGIDYEEGFAPVARIEAIRLFLAYASFMGFKDHDHPDKVYKVVKALYGLHQAPRAWYETLANYMSGNGFKRGKIDQTLFIKKQKGDIMLVQVYVDNIIFGSTKKELCTAFEKLMKDKFQMSSMGELTFFLGLQVQQKEDGIFISQDKYVAEILKKFNYTDVKSASTPVDLEKPLVKDGDADDVDVHLYRSMIGSLMYLTASRPDIMFAVCACARFQVTPKTSHLLAIKRIFRYLKGKPTLGLWYSRDSPFELVAYTDSDYARATQDRKSTTRGCQFLGNRLISWQCKKQTVVATSTTEAEYVAAASCCGQVLWIQNQLLDYGYNFMNTMIHIDNNSTICIIENPVQHSKTKHIEIRHHFIRDCNAKKLIQMVKIDTEHNVADLLTKGFDAGSQKEVGTLRYLSLVVPLKKVGDEAVHKELGDRMERAATTASSLEAEQESVTAAELLTTVRHHLVLPVQVNAAEVMDFGLTHAWRKNEDGVRGITATIDKKVKVFVSEASIRRHLKLEDSGGEEFIEELDLDVGISLVLSHAVDHGRIDDTHISDQPEEQLGIFSAATTLVDATRRRRSVENVQTYTKRRREVSTSSGGVSTASRLVSTADISTVNELDSTAGVKAKDKGKAIMHESEPPKKIKKREARFKAEQEQKRIDFETALELQKQLDEREEVAAKVDQAHDIDWSDPAVLRYHTLQNRPFSVAEVRKNMCLYLKNQGGYKMSHFKGMSYEDIRPIFERVWDQNQAFIPMGSEIEKEVMKRSGFDLQQESSKPVEEEIKSLARKRARETLSEESAKKQKLEDDTEKEELQVYLNIVPEDESLDVESLATKYPIVDWETQILANDKYYYQIKRADGSVKHYKLFSAMLYDFDRQDVLELYRLVKERFQIASPEGYDLLL